MDRIAIYYDLPDNIEILPDETEENHDKEGEQKKEKRGSNDSDDGHGDSSSRNSTRNAGCEVKSEEQLQLGQVTHVTDITDYRNKQALVKEKLSVDSALEEEQAKAAGNTCNRYNTLAL